MLCTARSLSELSVLVVDDDPGFRRLASRQLKRLRVKAVATAADGVEAIDALTIQRTSVDVVMCDLRMPREDGLVLLRRLGELRQPPSVVLVSGQDHALLDAGRRLAVAYHLNVLGALSKPFEQTDVATVLSRYTAAYLAAEPTSTQRTTFDSDDVRHALDEGRFEPWFQPQMDLETGRVVGAEALLRMHHAEHGPVAPGHFLDAVVSEGMLPAIGVLVLRRALAHCAEWKQSGVELSVSINVAPAAMEHDDFPDIVEATCQAASVPPEQVVFELTETSVAPNATVLLEILTRLRVKGVHISIDDFGTGHSSLEQLQKLPFTEVKFDSLLISSSLHDARSRLILQNSVSMAAQLGMSTVAEGVETTEALNMVTDMGCDRAQGFLFAKAMPGEELPAWIARQDTVKLSARS